MITLYGIPISSLPEPEELRRCLPTGYFAAWEARHGKIRNTDRMRASLGGIYLLSRMEAGGRLCYTNLGRPYLTDTASPMDLSISHTAGMVFCALGTGRDGFFPPGIGMDAEDFGRMGEAERLRIAGRWFPPAERGEANDEESFLRIWTRRESAVKRTGRGLCALRDADMKDCRFTVLRLGGCLVTVCHGEDATVRTVLLP